ncbi:hypothetical protein FVQ98_05695 [Ottowia sp. GY511]|uniref:histidine kinase n=1 Tax=Ottowia flava TaxID=2675430 RepID=A0ABW4KV66_9BURK|nr:ATP-binding protein [Ottowia sp. GY511]TXK31457.1 hypothetical protein FVQ98_05695 [Ottowia sp. GY511]
MRLSSLRARLLVLLTAFHVGAALAMAVLTYVTADYLDSTFMDGQMRALADAYLHVDEPVVPPAVEPERNVHDWGALIAQMWSPERVLQQSSWPSVRVPLQPTDGFHDLSVETEKWRVLTAHSTDRTVQIVQSGRFRAAELRSRAWTAALAVLALTPLSVLLAMLAVRWALRPMERLRMRVQDQDPGRLVPLDEQAAPDELRPFVGSINALLTRLATAFEQQRHFIQDAAHELRTPVAALSLQTHEMAEAARSSTLLPAAQTVHAAAGRLTRLVAQLLALARLDRPVEVVEHVSLSALAQQVVKELLPLADARQIDMGVEDDGAGLPGVDSEATHTLLVNLLDNALRHSSAGGRVTVRLCAQPTCAVLEVLDEGPGIPDAHLERVFDRFYRVPGQQGAGSGLGLAICQVAAARLGGTLTLANRTDMLGLVARFVLDMVERPA